MYYYYKADIQVAVKLECNTLEVVEPGRMELINEQSKFSPADCICRVCSHSKDQGPREKSQQKDFSVECNLC